jgi:hypothetical protein
VDETRIPFTSLRLDEENPRLPEEFQHASQPSILGYLYTNANLDELARSYIDNGFFQHEQLVVVPHGDDFAVLEGNRRLAAVKVLLEDADTLEAGVSFALDGELTPERRNELERPLPAFVVPDREEVRKYLGFRHIGGIKTWSAEAKARYLADEVELVRDEPNPFLLVARRVGSNVQGVRGAYIAISILRYARDELGFAVAPVQHRRFGVWLRCMNSPDLRAYIGLGDPRSYREVQEALSLLDGIQLREVLDDLIPLDGERIPVLADSRDVTVYAQALTIPQARAALRDFRDMDLVRQIVRQANLPDRLTSQKRSLESILEEVGLSDNVELAAIKPAKDVKQVASAVEAVVSSKAHAADSAQH